MEHVSRKPRSRHAFYDLDTGGSDVARRHLQHSYRYASTSSGPEGGSLAAAVACMRQFYSFDLPFGAIVRLGEEPATREYLAKSFAPLWILRKSSSNSSFPLTTAAGALGIPKVASENIVAFLISLASSGFLSVNFLVAADSMA